MITASTVATSTCESVSIASAQTPMKPIQREHEEGRHRRAQTR